MAISGEESGTGWRPRGTKETFCYCLDFFNETITLEILNEQVKIQIRYMISNILSRKHLGLKFDIFSPGWVQRIIKIIEYYTHTHTDTRVCTHTHTPTPKWVKHNDTTDS